MHKSDYYFSLIDLWFMGISSRIGRDCRGFSYCSMVNLGMGRVDFKNKDKINVA